MVGGRTADAPVLYPASDVAAGHGAGGRGRHERRFGRVRERLASAADPAAVAADHES